MKPNRVSSTDTSVLQDNRFARAMRGAGLLVGVQVFIAVGQFIYGGIVGRIFDPAVFGGFAAILSLQGLLIVLTTTGLPSYVLKEAVLRRGDLTALRLYTLLGSGFCALILFFAGSIWLTLLNAEIGTMFILPLALAQFIAPIAATESAIYRRGGSQVYDAVSILGAYLSSSTITLGLVFTIGEPWTLGAAVPINAVVWLLLILMAPRGRADAGREGTTRQLFRYAWRVTSQNVVSSGLTQAPAWVVSQQFGASTLGQYSRATTLTALPTVNVAGAVARALQPQWRSVKAGDESRIVSQAGAIAAGLLFPPLALLAGSGSSVVALWLGPGWELAGALVYVLAPAYALQGVYLVLLNSAELRSRFRAGRVAQMSMAVVLVMSIGTLTWTQNILIFSAGLAAMQLVGLCVLALRCCPQPTPLIRALAGEFATAILIFLGSVGGAHLVTMLSGQPQQSNAFLTLLGSVACAGTVWVVGFRFTPTGRILRGRGVTVPVVLPG